MFIAQQLYEGITLGNKGNTGLITYMRTDSIRVSDEAKNAAKNILKNIMVKILLNYLKI